MTSQTIVQGTLTGLIGTAIFYILLPLFKRFGNWLITFMSKVSKRFSNYLYKSLAIGKTTEPLLSLLIIFPILLIVNILIYQQTVRNSKTLANNQYFSWTRNMTYEITYINEKLDILESRHIVKNDSTLKRFYDSQKMLLNKQKEILIKTDKKLQENISEIEIYHRKIESLFLALIIVSFFLLIIFYFKYLIYHFIISQNRDF